MLRDLVAARSDLWGREVWDRQTGNDGGDCFFLISLPRKLGSGEGELRIWNNELVMRERVIPRLSSFSKQKTTLMNKEEAEYREDSGTLFFFPLSPTVYCEKFNLANFEFAS